MEDADEGAKATSLGSIFTSTLAPAITLCMTYILNLSCRFILTCNLTESVANVPRFQVKPNAKKAKENMHEIKTLRVFGVSKQ